MKKVCLLSGHHQHASHFVFNASSPELLPVKLNHLGFVAAKLEPHDARRSAVKHDVVCDRLNFGVVWKLQRRPSFCFCVERPKQRTNAQRRGDELMNSAFHVQPPTKRSQGTMSQSNSPNLSAGSNTKVGRVPITLTRP